MANDQIDFDRGHSLGSHLAANRKQQPQQEPLMESWTGGLELSPIEEQLTNEPEVQVFQLIFCQAIFDRRRSLRN